MRIPIKNIFVNTCLAFLSLLFFFAIFEFALRIGLLDGLNSIKTIWIPSRYKNIDLEINLRNNEFSKNNRFGFNDKERDVNKKSGSYRIAVLGDSVIWGSGLSYDDIWSHKLESKFTKYSDKLEVLSWGRCGWSTRREFIFLKNEGVKYGINLLIVSFSSNDPDMGDFKAKSFSLQKHKIIVLLQRIFPNVIEFIDGALSSVINRFSKDFGGRKWMEKLYSVKNLEKYDNLLAKFSNFCNLQHVKLLFVLVPSNYDPYYEAKFNKIKPLLEKNHIEYLDLYPVVLRDLGKYKIRQLKANPANGHPGRLLTEVFANEVFRYLVGTNAEIRSFNSEFGKTP